MNVWTSRVRDTWASRFIVHSNRLTAIWYTAHIDCFDNKYYRKIKSNGIVCLQGYWKHNCVGCLSIPVTIDSSETILFSDRDNSTITPRRRLSETGWNEILKICIQFVRPIDNWCRPFVCELFFLFLRQRLFSLMFLFSFLSHSSVTDHNTSSFLWRQIYTWDVLGPVHFCALSGVYQYH